MYVDICGHIFIAERKLWHSLLTIPVTVTPGNDSLSMSMEYQLDGSDETPHRPHRQRNWCNKST